MPNRLSSGKGIAVRGIGRARGCRDFVIEALEDRALLNVGALLAAENKPPDAFIHTPVEGWTYNNLQTIPFECTAWDEDGTVVAWDWQVTGPQNMSFNVEDPGRIRFPIIGDYTVTLTVTDNEGLSDPTPAVVRFRVGEVPGPKLLGEVTAGRAKVSIYDCDGIGSGIPIDGDYDSSDGTPYDPYDLSNDLMIVGTPQGVVIVARAKVRQDGQWRDADFTGLGIHVSGKILAFVDQRLGAPGDICFIVGTAGINSAVIRSRVVGGSEPIELYNSSGARYATLARGGIVEAVTERLGSLVIFGTGDCLTGGAHGGEIGSVILAGGASGHIFSERLASLVYIGYGRDGGDMTGQITAGGLVTLYAKGNITGKINVPGTLGTLYATGNVASDLDAGYLTTFYAGGNIGGTIDVTNNLGTLYAKGSVNATINAKSIHAVVAGNGFDAALRTQYLNSLLVQKGDLAGRVTVDNQTLSIAVLSGDFRAKLTSLAVASISIPRGMFRGSIDAAFVGTLVAAGSGAAGEERATILVDFSLNNLFVLGDMDSTDVGVGARNLPAENWASLGFLYVKGNLTRSNVLVGVRNENDGTQSASNPFSDGDENGTPFIPDEIAGSAVLRNVYVGGRIGTPGGGAGQWAIASKDKGIWKVPAHEEDYIIMTDV